MEGMNNLFIEQFYENVNKNRNKVSLDYKKELNIVISNLEKQIDIINDYSLVIQNDPYAFPDEYTKMVFSALYKNLISIFSAIELTKLGLCGSARMLFRNIYENLVLGKTICITKNLTLLEKWESGKDISIKKESFMKIKNLNSKELRDFWSVLCCYTHGTLYSQQIDLRYEEIGRDIKLNFAFIIMLLYMNYHVLNTHALNNTLKYNTKFTLSTVEEGLYEKKLRNIRKELNEMKGLLIQDPKKILYDFCLRWSFKDD